MFLKPEVKSLIADLFEEEALVIGGLVATYEVDDDLVWSLSRSLDVIRERTLSSLGEEKLHPSERDIAEKGNLQPHPAIQELLRRIHDDTP